MRKVYKGHIIRFSRMGVESCDQDIFFRLLTGVNLFFGNLQRERDFSCENLFFPHPHGEGFCLFVCLFFF